MLILLSSFWGVRGFADDNKCNKYKEEKNNDAPTNSDQNIDIAASAVSPNMAKCIRISKNYLKFLYRNNDIDSKFKWEKYIAATDECVKADQNCNETDSNLKKCDEIKKLAQECDAAAFILKEFSREWDNPEHAKPDRVQSATAPIIKCESSGVETLDFEGCVKFVQNGAILEVVQRQVYKGQELIYTDQTMTAQADAAKNGNTATGSLEALKNSVKSQEEMMNQRAGIDSGKLALLESYYNDMPVFKDLEAICKNYKPKYFTNVTNAEAEAACIRAIKNKFAFLKNGNAKNQMQTKLVQVGAEIGVDLLKASLMAKQAGSIGDTIAKVEAFKPIDPTMPPTDTLQTTFCQQNPGDPKCLTGGLERTFDAMGDNIITFGDGGIGGTFQTKNPLDPNTATTTNALNPTERKPVGSVGSVISAAQQAGGLATTAAAANVTKGSAPPAGGGGGGSGGGGSGGGGSGGGAAGAGGATSSAISSRAPTYGGGGGTLSMMGGFGINKVKSSAKDDANPFGKLFAKESAKSGVLDLGRSPASKLGGKGDNLFDMISNRYSSVNSDKRLLEYELAK